MRLSRMILILFLALVAAPVAVSATLYAFSAARRELADGRPLQRRAAAARAAKPEAAVRIFAARTVRWRGIFAVHSWIVFKDKNAPTYTRYDYTAWGEPIRVNGFAADGRWFGEVPETVFAADGAEAERLIPKIKAAIAGLRVSQLRRLPRLAGTELQHVRRRHHRRRAGDAHDPAADGRRQGLSLRSQLAVVDRHRLSRHAWRLPHTHRRLDRGHRAQPVRRRGRPRHPQARDQAAGARPDRHERRLPPKPPRRADYRSFGRSRSIAKSSNHGRSRPAISSPITCAAR